MRDRILSSLGRWVVAHPWHVLAGALVLSVASGALLPDLDIHTSRRALYPTHVEANRRFQDFLDDFATTSNLIMVLEGEPDQLGPFAEDLAVALEEERDVVSSVFYRADVDFFSERAFLFLSVEQMERLREKLETSTEQLDQLGRLNGLAPVLDAFAQIDSARGFSEKIDLESAQRILAAGRELFVEMEHWLDDPDRKEVKLLEKLFLGELSGRDHDREGYLRSHDRRMLFMFVSPTSNDEEFEYIHELVTRCRAAAARTGDGWREQGREPPTVGLAGLPANADEEMLAIRHDVALTVSVAAVAILLIIFVGFRSLRRGLLVFVPLVLAGLWNMGVCALTIGHLTILTSAFTAILFGLGVDYGIFISSRIQEERWRGRSVPEAVVLALTTAGRTLLTAGGTTAVAFFVIGTVEFTGFSELGIVAGTGVVLVMLSTLLVLPALSVVAPPALRPRPKSQTEAGVTRRPPLLFTGFVTMLALALAACSLVYALKIPLDYDLRNILPEDSESIHYQREMARRSDFQPEFAAVIADDLDQARDLAARLAALPTVSRVESITSLLPENQARKVEIVRAVEPVFNRILVPRGDFQKFTADELAEKLEDMVDMVADAQERAFAGGQKELVAALDKVMTRMESVIDKLSDNPDATRRARDFEQELFATLAGAVDLTRKWARVGPIKPDEMPRGILDRFKGRSGRYVVYAFPAESIYDMEFLDRFLEEVYRVAPDATGFPTTHQVFSRMILAGFRQATLYAVVVVFLLLLIDFRRVGLTLSATLPLSFGAAWMFGLMYFLRLDHNYANIIALPLVIGLAVDYGVFITHRLYESRKVHPFATMEKAGLPVIMAALTTAAGIGAICLARHRGAASLGEALLYGIACCLVAAIVVLPSAVAFARGMKERLRRPSKASRIERDEHEGADQ